MDLTLLLAVYGAVLGTLGFGLSFILAMREHSKEKRVIRVILEYVVFFEYLQIKIVNTNFRPITITGVGGQLMEKSTFRWVVKEPVPENAFLDIPKPNFPISLEDGESITIKLQQVMSSYFWDKANRLEVYVHDSEGNIYSQTDRKVYNPKYNRYERSKLS